jgi:hypothetical protein
MDIRNLLNYPEENNYMVASNDEEITNRILRSFAHSKMTTQQATTTTVWNRQKSAPVKLKSIWRV